MPSAPAQEWYSPREIASAAGVGEEQAIAAAGGADRLIRHADALRLARALRRGMRFTPAAPFSVFVSTLPSRRAGVTLALSGTMHAGAIGALIFIAALGRDPTAADVSPEPRPANLMRLVYLAAPGPGGGGGGGGLRQKSPAPKALREGGRPISSPLPVRQPPPPIDPFVEAPAPLPAIRTEPLPTIAAPIVASPADTRDRIGILQPVRLETDSHGPGSGAGAGKGTGTGLGEGSGSGVGAGAGGGTGGGPFRPGSDIEPPRLLHEVKPTYPEDARRSGLGGEVDVEIVVRRDGSVGDIRILKGLSAGLNDRATEAVRHWRFSPARRLGVPVDVIVEVSVEFRLR